MQKKKNNNNLSNSKDDGHKCWVLQYKDLASAAIKEEGPDYITVRGNYSDMASPALSKDIDFFPPQAQEVERGCRSDRVSWRKAGLRNNLAFIWWDQKECRKLGDLHLTQTDICSLPFRTWCQSEKSPITYINHYHSSPPCSHLLYLLIFRYGALLSNLKKCTYSCFFRNCFPSCNSMCGTQMITKNHVGAWCHNSKEGRLSSSSLS